MTDALVMAGGRSERMRAHGDSRHKAVRRVAGRRLVDWNLQALAFFGFTEIYVAVNAREDGLIESLRPCRDVHLLVERAPLGTIGAARNLPPSVTNVVVVNVDNLSDMNLAALARFHLAEDAAMTIATHEETVRIPCGIVHVEGDRVVAYEEKPRRPLRISSGTYVLNRRAIDLIEPDRPLDVPELVATLLGAGERVRAWTHSARWIDVNDETSLMRAENIVRESGADWPGAQLLPSGRA
jgi:NDP-sugar pyrophosphorylase family protein